MSFRRILIKLSGESLKGDSESGLCTASLHHYGNEIKSAVERGVQVALVVGGGNFIRGKELAETGLDRTTADYMGMVATVINALALQNVLENMGVSTRVMSGIEMPRVCEPYIQRRADRHLEKGRVALIAAGTGNPYFSTDTAAALRGLEIKADVFLKGTRVDGVYDADPEIEPNAKKFERITFKEALERDLQVLDGTAFALCRENKLSIIVFNLTIPGNLAKIIDGDLSVGTIVSD